ncbi:MAG: DNA-processing protein DprA [Clostridia bacterium]|nr:DNA-processing protein DprA [Clostridia bacterium]
MDKKLIWMIKSWSISNTRKKLAELSKRKDLFDESTIDFAGEDYKEARKNYDIAVKNGYTIVTYIDKLYPEKLKNISTSPAVLYVNGNAKILGETVFAGVVGARKSDMYGTRTAENLALEIGQTGAGIISGGARGIDSAAHRGALRAKAPTVAVLGCGLDVCYPPENKKLFKNIVESGGAIITEFPFGMEAHARNFPKRNRIIAALSTALVVVRAAHRSGSLITASRALDMGVSVFALPGNIDDNLSAGTNALIRDGANILLSPIDVIDELIALEPDFFVREREKEIYEVEEKTVIGEKPKKVTNLSDYENEIVSIIESGAQLQSLIEEKISFEATRLTALLGMMEIKGIIKKGPDKKYTVTGGDANGKLSRNS